MILPRTPPDKCVLAAEKICRKIHDSPVKIYNGLVVSMTISAGVGGVHAATADTSLEALIKEADAALYAANRAALAETVSLHPPIFTKF